MKFLFSFFILSACFLMQATAGEVIYYKGSWGQIQAKAKAMHKYILVDGYTQWCSWCKVMDKETMTEPGIIAMVNDKFLAVKIDMEHGEGVKLAMKYHVHAYPTFMFFNPDGAYVYVSVGSSKPKEFSEELKNAQDKTKQFAAPGFSTSVDIDFPEFYVAAYGERGKIKMPKEAEVTAFLKKQKDLFSEVSWGVISRFELNKKYSQFFLDNIEKYQALYGSNSTDDKLTATLSGMERAAVKNKSNKEFDEVLTLADKYVKKDLEMTKLNLRLDFYKDMGQWDKFMTAFDEYITAHGYEDVGFINSLCWGMYEHCDNKALLTKASVYMRKAVDKEQQYALMDTYAALLYKSGQTDAAEDWANKAITQGQKEKQDVTATDDLLKKIEEGPQKK